MFCACHQRLQNLKFWNTKEHSFGILENGNMGTLLDGMILTAPRGGFFLLPPPARVTGTTVPVSALILTPVTGLRSPVTGSTALWPIMMGTRPEEGGGGGERMTINTEN